MSKRISHSLVDPWLSTPLKSLYRRLPIPASLPPEAIVGCGHLAAIAGAVGFGFALRSTWGGVLAALGVALNHTCDCLDGTHARATNQCRNGGELLDHFVDPLSFSYWVVGIAASATAATAWAPWIGIAGVLVIYATAVLTNIRAKMIGEFTLARFGPTEFKLLLVLFGLAMTVAATRASDGGQLASRMAAFFLSAMTVAGFVQLAMSLVSAVRVVNSLGAAPADVDEWELRR